MSSVRKICFVTFVLLFAYAGVSMASQQVDQDSAADQAGIFVLAEEDHSPADDEQSVYLGQSEENADQQAQDDPENTMESGRDDFYHGNNDGLAAEPENSTGEPAQVED